MSLQLTQPIRRPHRAGPAAELDVERCVQQFPILKEIVHGKPLDLFRQRRFDPEAARRSSMSSITITSTTTPTCIAASTC